MLYLYDPRTNILTETTYNYLQDLTGKNRANLASYKSRRLKIKGINCYLADENTTVEQRREWYEKEKYHDEHWINISGSEYAFKISNYGRVKRIYKNGREKFLLPFRRKKKGNLFIKVRWKGRYGEYKISQLVASHFIREPNLGEAVIHKNSIITDDYAGNLKVVTNHELGKLTGHKAGSKPVVMIDTTTNEVIDEFRSAREAGRKTFFSYQAILDRCNKKFPYRNEPYVFRFSEDHEEMEVN